MRFKNADMSARKFGEELGVGYVLTGIVRWEPRPEGAPRVHITPELIKISDNTQVWSDLYPNVRSDSGSSDVQVEIAECVLQELGIRLSKEERRMVRAGTSNNDEAQSYYMRGNDFELHGGEDRDNVLNMIQMHSEAVKRDPDFAEAWAKLSKGHSVMYWFEHDRTEDRRRKAQEALDKALKLDHELPETIWANGFYNYWCLDRYYVALELFKQAQNGKPYDSQFIAATAYAQRRMGRFPEALANLQKAFEADPLSRTISASLGQTFMIMRQYPDADEYLTRSIGLAPAFSFPYAKKAQLYLRWRGRTEEAKGVLDEALRNVAVKNQEEISHLLVDVDIYDENYHGALSRLKVMLEDVNDVTAEDAQQDAKRRMMRRARIYLRRAQIYKCMDKDLLERDSYDRAQSNILEAKTHTEFWDAYTLAILHSWHGIVLAGLGDASRAVERGEQAVRLMKNIKNELAVLWRKEDLARIYAIVDDADSAMEMIEPLVDPDNPGELSVQMLKIDPAWADLKGNPRFERLIESVE
jgi:tetratricopeptide (TPR) repeat protein